MKRGSAVFVAAVVLFCAAGAFAAEPTLKIEKANYAQGEEIVVKFTAPKYPANAWVGIIPSKIPHGDEAVNDQHDMTYQYLGGKTKGTLVFTAPNKNGKYDFRMNNSDNNGKEVASVSFMVK